jgi:hypothetical protein
LYTRLDSAEIIETAERLARRVAGQFPGSGLSKVAAEVVAVARRSDAHARLLSRPMRPIRLLVAAVLATGFGFALMLAINVRDARLEGETVSLVQGLEASMNIVVLVGIGVIALTRMESAWKKRRALAALHPLRSLAHVVDMHQLAKDPEQLHVDEEEAPAGTLSPAALVRYLDYCTELLAVIGKLAALYAQSLYEPGVVQGVNEIEVLTTNLSRKIWQKIAIVTRGIDQDHLAGALTAVKR